jgi:hypothetical protein
MLKIEKNTFVVVVVVVVVVRIINYLLPIPT